MTMTGMCDECAERPAVVRVVRLDSLGAARGPLGVFCRECLAEVATWFGGDAPRRNAEYPPVQTEEVCLN